MADEHTARKKKGPSAKDFWRLILMIIGVIAIVQELRKAPDDRTWHGKVADLVPYDFRKPSMDRFKAVYWNEDGPFLGPKAWGVGWAPNFGAVKKVFEKA
jgi:hypothetical protein